MASKKSRRQSRAINEALKKSFVDDKIDHNKLSNNPDIVVKAKTISDDPLGGSIVIDGSNQQNDYSFDFSGGLDQFGYQNQVIETYRRIASDPEVSNGVDIICNEIIYTVNPDVFKISIDEENEKISDVINEKFRKVLNTINVKENIYNLARQMYIDGQLNVTLAYDKTDIAKGIIGAHIMEPMNLYFDSDDGKWKYNLENDELNMNTLYNTEINTELSMFTEAELVHVDYGMYSKIIQQNELSFMINLGYLENVGSNANMLKTLENMLVPLRYSRSVSRRLFNIDIAELPPKQGKELMDKIRAEFRYKKSYDPATGTIKNIKNTQPLVEDYWMSNRSGSKGTTVDTMDEKGALMDLEDIKHAAKKLYTSMNLPPEFNPYSDDQATFSFDNTEVSQSLMKFYIFVSRLRKPIAKLIKEILRRELVATGVFQDSEWKKYEEKIEISFTAESIFLENAKKEQWLKGVESFINIKENIGESISLQTAVENTFSWSTEQLAEELEKIEEEKMNPLFKAFYARDTEGDADGGAWR